MRISRAAVFFVGMLLLSGCGGAVRGCARVVEHSAVVRAPTEIKIAPTVHDLNIRPTELPKNDIHLKNDNAEVRQDPQHSEEHSFVHKIPEEAIKKLGEHGIKEAGKSSESKSDSKSESKNSENH